MKLSKGKWYKDSVLQYDRDERVVYEQAFNNPRIRTCMYPQEFIDYTNKLEGRVRDLFKELTELGIDLQSMYPVADIINDTNGGA